MKNKILITLIGGLLTLSGYAQQDATFTQYFFNPMFINPGYAGSRDVLSGTLVHRSQWLGMEGAPTTQALNVHSAIPNTNLGIGLQAYHDQAGPMNNTGFSAIFAYHLRINEKTKLAFGLAGTVNNIRVGFDNINVENTADETFMGNAYSAWVPDANFGLYLYQSRFYAGLSVRHLIQTQFDMETTPGADQGQFKRHYYATVGFVRDLTTTIGIRPSAMVRYVHAAPVMADINASLIFRQRLYVGLGLRTGKRIDIKGMDNILIASAEYVLLNRLRFGYSYDFYANRNGAYNRYGTHEVMLGWDLSFTKTKMESPRFF